MTPRAPSLDLLRALRSAIRIPQTTSPVKACRRPMSRPQNHTPRNAARAFSTTTFLKDNSPNSTRNTNPYAPTSRDRGPKSTEDTQTDFSRMDVLGHIAAAATSIDACTSDGFHLDNGVKTDGGSGICLAGGEAFAWTPWLGVPPAAGAQDTSVGPHTLLDARKGLLNLPRESLGLLELLHPKPDLLIVGTGGKLWMLGKETRAYISEVLGCRLDTMDTANAAAAYNLLAKERGIEGGGGVGGLFLPIGWVGPRVGGYR